MRRWWMVLIFALLFAMLATSLKVAWLKNLAMLRLQSDWAFQQKVILDPPCGTQWKFSIINKYLEEGVAFASPNPSSLTQLGRALWLEGDCTKAASLWEQASKSDYAPAEYELMRIGEFTTFSTELRAKFAVYAFNQGEALDKLQQYQAASQWYNRSLELVPDHKTAERLISLHQKIGDVFDVAGMWRKIVDAYPETDAEYWYAKGELYYLNTDWQLAARAYTKSAILAADPYEPWLNAGYAWLMVNNWEQAEGSFIRANQIGPKFIEGYLALGTVNRMQQKYQVAFKWYSKAVELFPKASAPYIYLGQTYYLMGDYVQARQNLDLALKIEPKNTSGMYLLAQVSYREGNIGLAETWLVEAISLEMNPHILGSWWIELGDWRLEQHNCSGTLEAYTNASRIGENSATIQQKLTSLTEVCNP